MQSKFKRILFGGDYNPNQWPKEVWEQDMDLFRERTGIALEPTVQESPWYFVR